MPTFVKLPEGMLVNLDLVVCAWHGENDEGKPYLHVQLVGQGPIDLESEYYDGAKAVMEAALSKFTLPEK